MEVFTTCPFCGAVVHEDVEGTWQCSCGAIWWEHLEDVSECEEQERE